MTLMLKNIASPKPQAFPRSEVAVLLNQNAKKVRPSTRTLYESIVPKSDLYWSRSLEEAQAHVEQIVERGYSMLFLGGGDGTIGNTLNLLQDKLRQMRPGTPCPRIGVLKLGTGNAIAHMLGAHRPVECLQHALRGERIATKRIELIEEGGRLLPFSGMGWDAAILNDFISLKDRYNGRLGKKVFCSLLGYAAAISLKTIPRELFRREVPAMRVRNLGNAVHLLPDGRTLPIPKGTLLFEGSTVFAGVATVPFYGYGLKVFPFADTQPGKMHLRISTMGVAETLVHLPAIWKGTYRSPGLLDFLVDDIEMEADEPLPFQISGDAQGTRHKAHFRISQHSVDLLDFSAPRA